MLRAITRFFSSNLLSKLLAVLLAGVVYAYVYAEREHDATMSVPLTVTGLRPGLVLHNDPPDLVKVAFRASGSRLLKLRMQTPRAVVDLAEVGPGEMQHLLSPGDIEFPVDAEATVRGVIEPRVILLDVDTLVVRRIPVEVPLQGDLPSQWTWDGGLEVDPPTVSVQGPLRSVDSLAAVGTGPVDLGEILGTTTRTLAVTGIGSGLTVEPGSVRVVVPVSPVTERSLAGLPVAVLSPPGVEFVRVMPESATVLVSGPKRLLDPLDPRGVRVVLEARDLAPGLHRLAPRVALPHDSLHVRAMLPSEFLLEVGPRRRP
jgi:YbbR domain-containing protein